MDLSRNGIALLEDNPLALHIKNKGSVRAFGLRPLSAAADQTYFEVKILRKAESNRLK